MNDNAIGGDATAKRRITIDQALPILFVILATAAYCWHFIPLDTTGESDYRVHDLMVLAIAEQHRNPVPHPLFFLTAAALYALMGFHDVAVAVQLGQVFFYVLTAVAVYYGLRYLSPDASNWARASVAFAVIVAGPLSIVTYPTCFTVTFFQTSSPIRRSGRYVHLQFGDSSLSLKFSTSGELRDGNTQRLQPSRFCRRLQSHTLR